MKRIAIVGGGIAGLSAAYELARQQRAGAPIQFRLFEGSDRLGGTVDTEFHDGFVIECGPDSWVSEKPWARELALELGLESDLIFSRDQHRVTYLAEGGELRPMPNGMRMMVPVEWEGVLSSPLFSEQAKRDYLQEPERAEFLKSTALDAAHPVRDESVRDFVVRHFGEEVANTIAAPLLAGVFGGDIAALSARAVLPAFVALEREHGSLILGLQQKKLSAPPPPPIFTSLRRGLSSLIEALESYIPAENIRCRCPVAAIGRGDAGWLISLASGAQDAPEQFDAILIATPAKVTARLLNPHDSRMAELLPGRSSSSIVVALAFSREQPVHVPQGFGFLAPRRDDTAGEPRSRQDTLQESARRALLACTFVDQKFSDRAPAGAVLLRAFFGGDAVSPLLKEDDGTLASLAQAELERVLGKLPSPVLKVIRRWPDSLPLYTVGHLDRVAELETHVRRLPNIRLIGNAYRGVGLPDLIGQGRNAAREMIQRLSGAEPSRRDETT